MIELAQDAIEEIDNVLCGLQIGNVVTVRYYCHHRGECCQLTGAIDKIDRHSQVIRIGNACFDYSDIYYIYHH